MRFEDLPAWQLAYRLVLATYRQTRSFPPDERFGLTSQVRRAALSVAANLAEGCAKRGSKELRRYADIANGSLAELQCLLLMARDIEYLTDEEWKSIESLRAETGRSNWNLYRSLAPKPRK